MAKITVEHNPSQERLDALGILHCPTWSKEPSSFPWTYSEQETAYVLEGEVTVTPNGGEPVNFGKGDLVIFPAAYLAHGTLKKHSKSITNLVN